MKFKRLPRLGATGKHSEGKVHSSDEGDIRFAIAADTAHGVVVLDFWTPVKWMGLPPDTARQLAASLIEKANEVSGRPQ